MRKSHKIIATQAISLGPTAATFQLQNRAGKTLAQAVEPAQGAKDKAE